MRAKKSVQENGVKETVNARTKIIISTVIVLILVAIAFLTTRYVSIPFSIAGEETKPLIQVSLDKYLNYSLSEQEEGTLVQYSLRTGINYGTEQNYIPIKQSNIEIGLNQIENKYPYAVNVISKSTEATNGNKQSANYKYDSTTGSLLISTTNQDKDGKLVYGGGNTQDIDEYIIICNYKTYTEEIKTRQVGFEVAVKAQLDREENPEIESNGNFQVDASENIGDFTTVKYNTDEIYNGYIKSNKINGTNYSTIYKEKEEIIISKKEYQDQMELQEKSINSVYKSTKILKRNLKNVLGQDGILIIEDENGNKLGEINPETEFQDDGTYTINYEGKIESIRVKTSKVINEGIIELENVKEIKAETQDIDSVKTETQIIGKKEGTQVYSKNSEKGTKIEDAKTEVNLSLNKNGWTNERQNEIAFDIKLNTNGSKYNLYKNPTIKIELPEEVEKVILGDCSLVYGNGLQQNEIKVETNENNRYQIIASLTGEQTQYNENELGLTTEIRIPAIIILKQDIENKTDNIKVTTINEYGTSHIEEYNKEVELINFKEDVRAELNELLQKEKLFEVARADAPQQEVNNNLELEVAPTKGETVLLDGDTVYEGEFIKYNIKVTNTSDQDMEDVKLVATIPEGVTYGELDADFQNFYGKYEYNFEQDTREKELSIGKIKAGDTKTLFYEVKVNDDLPEGVEEKNIQTVITSYTGEAIGQKFEANYTIKPAAVRVFMNAKLHFERENCWIYEVYIDSEEDKDYLVTLHLPENLGEIEETYREKGTNENLIHFSQMEEINFQRDNNIATATLNSKNIYTFKGMLDLSNVQKQSDGSPINMSVYAEITDNNVKYTSNEVRMKVYYEYADIIMSSENEGENVRPGDEITYKIEIKNSGKVLKPQVNPYVTADGLDINLIDILPDEVLPTTITYNNWNREIKENGTIDSITEQTNIVEDLNSSIIDENGNKVPQIDLHLIIPQGKSVIVDVKAIARYLEKTTVVTNSATISGSLIDMNISNSISHTIIVDTQEDNNDDESQEPSTPSDPDDYDDSDDQTNQNEDNTNELNKCSISGIAWLDDNEDGSRQSNEERIGNIRISLINLENSSEIQSSVETDNNGYYSFNNLSHGKYIVIVRYDTSMYKLTEYQKENVSSNINSDVFRDQITINSEQVYAGLTDILDINESQSNIDIGLIKIKPYDLKIEKYISKITVKTNKSTKEYNYNNSKLAKVEIKAKEIEGAIVTVEYNIAVTNIGETSATINNVKDSLPDGFVYISDENWNKNKNGDLINVPISNRTINAGEKIELKLVATKTMSANTTGTFTNNVAIINEEDTTDKDISNNTAKADLIISISTGVKTYIIISVLALIGLIIVAVINKKEITKLIKIKKPSKFGLLVVFVATLLATSIIGTTSSEAANKTTDFIEESVSVTKEKISVGTAAEALNWARGWANRHLYYTWDHWVNDLTTWFKEYYEDVMALCIDYDKSAAGRRTYYPDGDYWDVNDPAICVKYYVLDVVRKAKWIIIIFHHIINQTRHIIHK